VAAFVSAATEGSAPCSWKPLQKTRTVLMSTFEWMIGARQTLVTNCSYSHHEGSDDLLSCILRDGDRLKVCADWEGCVTDPKGKSALWIPPTVLMS
jgi:hypothetical protein